MKFERQMSDGEKEIYFAPGERQVWCAEYSCGAFLSNADDAPLSAVAVFGCDCMQLCTGDYPVTVEVEGPDGILESFRVDTLLKAEKVR